jgi:hypothetical protein
LPKNGSATIPFHQALFHFLFAGYASLGLRTLGKVDVLGYIQVVKPPHEWYAVMIWRGDVAATG